MKIIVGALDSDVQIFDATSEPQVDLLRTRGFYVQAGSRKVSCGGSLTCWWIALLVSVEYRARVSY